MEAKQAQEQRREMERQRAEQRKQKALERAQRQREVMQQQEGETYSRIAGLKEHIAQLNAMEVVNLEKNEFIKILILF